ncbi:T6SS effector BTH_I2691 family protein [Pseudomonas sp. NPDC089752]|uniref:T6SS effector BTH_I2691 family protein n=1 Tax=Pseudomonas sp. NPDC089752 TaxID=3364472 RepID=UPI003808B4D4
MSISQTISIVTQEEIPNPYGTCNACERSGLPILLLREAYAPHPQETQSYRVSHDSEITYVQMRTNQLRTLRQGYVYVLLDKAIWHAYQVTPEGALRRFPASQMPLAAGRPLAEACRTQHHDVVASFINIDTQLFSKAWLAFANDPWPRDVLDCYQQGIVNGEADSTERFIELDLGTARNDPGSIGIAMTETELGLSEVLEYATAHTGKFISAHGFYPRISRSLATRNHVRTIIQQEALNNGVLALTLPDPVGMVTEANAQRTGLVRAMQEWRAEPQRHFEYFTSQALLGIRELNQARAAVQALEDTDQYAQDVERWNASPLKAKAPLPQVDVQAHGERAVEHKRIEARERLEERYDETARAAFQRAYDSELDHWQSMIDQAGAQYTHFYAQRAFQRIGHFDYSVTNLLSAEYFIRMLSACLAGGPTEAPPAEDSPLGATQELWQQLLEDPKSLLYQALVAKHQDLLSQLGKALIGDDASKLHDTIKGILTSQEGQRLMIKPVQDAIGQLLAATASAGNALGQHISGETKKLIGHVHSSAFLLFAGQPVIQIKVTLTLGEYLSVLNEALQERTDAYLNRLDEQFRKPAGRKVRAMVLSGAIHIASAGNRKQLVDVMVWTLESAESLQARLKNLRESAAGGVGELLREVSIDEGAFRNSAVRAMESVKLTADAAQQLASEAFRGLRGAASNTSGPGLLLALGSIWFHQDSLRTNYDKLADNPHIRSELLAAIGSSSLGALGAGIESVSFAAAILAPEKVASGVGTTATLAKSLTKLGGVVASLAYITDAKQFIHAAIRTIKQGDQLSAILYTTAGAAALITTFIGAFAAIAGSSLLGLLGIAAIAGLTAYGIAILAKNEESNLLELWARDSRWGMPIEQRRWVEAKHLDDAIGAANAATIGIYAEVSVQVEFRPLHTQEDTEPRALALRDDASLAAATKLAYSFHLPQFNTAQSHYEWQITIYRANKEGEPITLSSNSNKPIIEISCETTSLLAQPEPNAPTTTHNKQNGTLNIHGGIKLRENHDIQATSLTLIYWPDKSDDSGYAKLVSRDERH